MPQTNVSIDRGPLAKRSVSRNWTAKVLAEVKAKKLAKPRLAWRWAAAALAGLAASPPLRCRKSAASRSI